MVSGPGVLLENARLAPRSHLSALKSFVWSEAICLCYLANRGSLSWHRKTCEGPEVQQSQLIDEYFVASYEVLFSVVN